jgi:hypothetical protein
MTGRRVYTVTLAVALIGLAVPFCLLHRDWDTVYLPAARHLRDGDSIYQTGYVYPPFMAWLAVPFTYLPALAGKLAFFAVNALALLITLVAAWRLAGGGRLEGEPPVPLREHVIAWLGGLTGISYALAAFGNQQTDLVIAALILTGCLLLVRGRDLWAGASIGMAAAMKVTPLLFVPYLMWRGWWRSAFVAVLVAVGVNLLSDVTHPSRTGELRLTTWVAEYVSPLAGAEHRPGTWFTGVNFNHSVAGVGNRWWSAEQVWQGDTFEVIRRPDRPVLPLKVGVYAACGFLIVIVVIAMRRMPPGGEAVAMQLGLLLALMPLLSPVSSKPHFVVLLLPGMMLARAAVSRPELLPRVLLGGAILSGLMANSDLVGDFVAETVKWYGGVLWNAVFLLAGCVVAGWRLTRAESVNART